MGEFNTETDLILHRSLRESLRYAKLIGDSNEEEDLKMYSRQLLRRYIEEQMIYFPNSGRIIDQWIVTASDLWESVIIRDEIPITEMPPCHQTALNASKEEMVIEMWYKMKNNILDAALREIDEDKEVF